MLQILRNGAEKLTLAGAHSLSIHRLGEVPHGERSAHVGGKARGQEPGLSDGLGLVLLACLLLKKLDPGLTVRARQQVLEYVCVEPIPPMKNDYGFSKELTLVFPKQVHFCPP